MNPRLRGFVRSLFFTGNTVRYRVELPRLKEALRLIAEMELAVDVGAGGGYYAIHAYAPVAKQVLAIEYDPRLYRLLQRETQRFRKKITSKQGSVLALPMETAAADLVAITQVIEHIDDDRNAMRELARVLKPGGHLLITVPHPPAPWPEGGHVREGYTLGDLQTLAGRYSLVLRHSDYFTTLPTQRVVHLMRRFGGLLPAILPLAEAHQSKEQRQKCQPYGLLALFQKL
jgi:SAM-dependent methyltransferase